MSIQIRISQLLVSRRKTAYWLAKETGISYTTLWRLSKGNSVGINFATLEKICKALECDPGDVLKITGSGKKGGGAAGGAKK